MKKRKPIKQNPKRMHMTARWEIITATKYVDKHFPDSRVNDKALMKIYQGNAVACIMDGVIESKQRWGVTIATRVKNDDGFIYPEAHEVTWRIDEPMTFNDFIKGNPKIRVNRGNGIQTRWMGVAHEWLKMVDEDLAGLIAIDAWATANCLAELKTSGVKPRVLDQYFKSLNVKDSIQSIFQGVQA